MFLEALCGGKQEWMPSLWEGIRYETCQTFSN